MSKMKKVLMLLALAGFAGACSSNSGSPARNDGNQNPNREATTAPESGSASATFSATHSGSFEISGWAGNSLTDVMAFDDLKTKVAGFDQLILSIDTLGSMGMAEGRRYEYDRANQILRLFGSGHTLEINSTGALLTADAAPTSDQGQAQATKEVPQALPCRLYKEEVKKEEKAVEQKGEQKGEEKPAEQGQAGEKAPAEKAPAETAPAEKAPAEQGQTQSQAQEVQQPEQVIVRCEQTVTSEQEQGQTQAQVKPESKTEVIHSVLTLTPEVKQEQKQETKVEEKAPVKEEKKEVKQEQKQETKVEEKAPVKEEKKEVKKEEKKEAKPEQKGEQKGEQKQEEKKPTGGGGGQG